MSHDEILRIEEIEQAGGAWPLGMGIRSVRLTGGEPLVRKGVVDLVRDHHRHPGHRERLHDHQRGASAPHGR